jgi:hypothetical protein
MRSVDKHALPLPLNKERGRHSDRNDKIEGAFAEERPEVVGERTIVDIARKSCSLERSFEEIDFVREFPEEFGPELFRKFAPWRGSKP